MSEQHDPRDPIEADPAFAELHAGLRLARERGPNAEQAARMRAALGLPTAPAANTGRTQPNSPAAARFTRSGWLKLIVCGALALGAAFGVWRFALGGPHVEPPQPGAPPVMLPASATPPPGAPVAVSDTAPALRGGAASGTAPALRGGAASGTAPALRGGAASGTAPALRGGASMPAQTPSIAEGAAGSAVEHAAPARPHNTPPRVVRATATTPAADPAAELALLKRAKGDARSAPAHALALVAEHEQRFPNGVLVEEREVIAIEALLALGERSASEVRAARFFTRFPNSAHARRIRALLDQTSTTQSDTNRSSLPHPSQ